jgi:hypothetical protein
MRRSYLSCVLAVLLLFGSVGTGSAQVTEITAQDFTDLVGTNAATQVLETEALDPGSTPDLQEVLDATGANQVYDLRPFSYSLTGQGIIRYRETGQAQSIGWPGANDLPFSQSTYAFALDAEAAGGQTFSVYTYSDITGSGDEPGVTDYGNLIEETTVTYDPPLLQYRTPLAVGPPATVWSDVTTTSVSVGGLPVFTQEETVDGEVEGYGTVRTPAGDFDVLRVRRETTSSGLTTTTIEFLSPEVGFTVATLNGLGDGTYEISVIGSSDDFAETTVEPGATGEILADNRLSVAFTTGSSTLGQLAIATYNQRPYNETFDPTSATSGDGTSVTPDVLWDGQYYTVLNIDDQLSGFDATVCIDVTGVPGVADIQKLVLLTRDFASQVWTALNTVVNGTGICADVTGLSQFAVGSNSQFNTLPVELTRFDVAVDGQRALLTWETASETDNAGFHVEHRAGEGSWARLTFIDGAGTRETRRRYRYETDGLAPGIHDFRLAQVDIDGTVHTSEAQRVSVRPAARLDLRTSGPNPAVDATEMTVVLREAADVTIEVFDLLGRRQAVLHGGPLSAGTAHRFPVAVSTWASGTYLVRVSGAGAPVTRRLTVVR